MRSIDMNAGVLVVGGGTAGAIAAIASARMGAKTAVVEQYGFLGGTSTAGLVTPMMPNDVGGQPLCAGISEEIQRRLSASGDASLRDGTWWFNPEALKYVLEEMALDAGVEILYHSFFSEPLMDGNTITGAVFDNISGRQRMDAMMVIDCTGDASVAASAGTPCMSGRVEDGVNQAMSLRFLVGAVDLDRLATFLNALDPSAHMSYPFIEMAMVWGRGFKLEPKFEEAVSKGILSHEDGDYFQAFTMPGRPNEMAFNCPRIHGDLHPLDARHLT
jgi:hypothetical protein